MNRALIARYQPGGDIYPQLVARYGAAAANDIAAAALTGERPAVTEAIAFARYGSPLDESTGREFARLLLNDPLAAPLDALDSGVSKIFSSSGVVTVLTVAAVVTIVLLAAKK